MGYYTRFEGGVHTSDFNVANEYEFKIVKALRERPYFEEWSMTIPVIDTLEEFFNRCGEMKWYDWRQDMKTISAKFPDIVIHIHGEGEDCDDEWDAYFKNGKIAYYPVKKVYGTFNPADLA